MNDKDYKLIGAAIKCARTKKGWSAKELSELVGLSIGYIYKIESAKQIPSNENLQKILNAVELTLQQCYLTNDVKSESSLIDENYKNIIIAIRIRLFEMSLTEKELGEKVGLSRQSISSILCHVHKPSNKNLKNILTTLELTLEDAIKSGTGAEDVLGSELEKDEIDIIRKAIKNQRMDMNLTEKALGKLVGMSGTNVNRIENGKHFTKTANVIKLLDVLGLRMEEVLSNKEVYLKQEELPEKAPENIKQLLIENKARIIKAIKSKRIHANLTNEDLGKLAGVSTPSINRMENGINFPKYKNFLKILEVLGLEIAEVINYSEPNSNSEKTRKKRTIKGNFTSFSKTIKIKRKAMQLSAEELGNKVGISGSTICRIESGKQIPKKETFEKLNRFLNLEASEL